MGQEGIPQGLKPAFVALLMPGLKPRPTSEATATTKEKEQQQQRLIGGREAGFSAPMLAKARAQPQRASALVGDTVAPVEMTIPGVGRKRKALGSLRSP